MTEEILTAYAARALDALERGETPDLHAICAEHPELIPELESILGLRDGLLEAHRIAEDIDPRIGQTVADRYTLLEPLGRGAMGIVYAAHDAELDRSIALKMFSGGTAASRNRDDEERFVREARALGRIDHDHVVRVFDRGTLDDQDGGLFLVMEHLRGLPLSAVLNASVEAHGDAPRTLPTFGPWWTDLWPDDSPNSVLDSADSSPRAPNASYLHTVVSWLADVASGLAAAHAQGVFHRDVKPSNIFLRLPRESSETRGSQQRLEAVLIDFGIAVKAGDAALTASQTTLGTPWYMPPEQVHGGGEGKASATLDVYALCATLYHLIALRPPYEGTAATVVGKLQNDDATPIRNLSPDLPRDLLAILEHGMERDPRLRYSTMAALERDLRCFLEHRPVSVRPLGIVQRLTRRARRRPAKALAWAATAVLLPTLLWAWSLAAERAERVLSEEVRRTIAALPRQLAVEGEPGTRLSLREASRQRSLDLLQRLVELEPRDPVWRIYRAALWTDSDDPQALRAWQDLSADLQPALIDWGAGTSSRPTQLKLQSQLERFVAALLMIRGREVSFADSAIFQLDKIDTPESLRTHALELKLIALTAKAEPTNDRQAWESSGETALDVERRRGTATARTLATRGLECAVLQRANDARLLLEQSEALCPGQYGVNLALASLARADRNFGQALVYLETARLAQPDNWRTVQARIHIETQQGRYDDALSTLAAATSDDGGMPRWRVAHSRATLEHRRAFTRVQQGQEPDALEGMRRAVAAYDNAAAWAPESLRATIQIRRDVADAFVHGRWNEALAASLASAGGQAMNPAILDEIAVCAANSDLPEDVDRTLEIFLRTAAANLSTDPVMQEKQRERLRALQQGSTGSSSPSQQHKKR